MIVYSRDYMWQGIEVILLLKVVNKLLQCDFVQWIRRYSDVFHIEKQLSKLCITISCSVLAILHGYSNAIIMLFA